MAERHKKELVERERASKQVRAQLRVLKEQFASYKENRDVQAEMYVPSRLFFHDDLKLLVTEMPS